MLTQVMDQVKLGGSERSVDRDRPHWPDNGLTNRRQREQCCKSEPGLQESSAMKLAIAFKSPLVPALGLSILFSLLLFMLMYSAIHVGKFVHREGETLQTIDFVRLKRDSEVETMSASQTAATAAGAATAPRRCVSRREREAGMTGVRNPNAGPHRQSVSGGPIWRHDGSAGAGACSTAICCPAAHSAAVSARCSARRHHRLGAARSAGQCRRLGAQRESARRETARHLRSSPPCRRYALEVQARR